MSEDETPELTPGSTKQTPESTPKPLKVEVLDKMATLITAAFGFVAAFAWNETFKVILLGNISEKDTPIVLVGYALLVTILAVFLTITIARASARAKKALK